jgi:hypothetical protein
MPSPDPLTPSEELAGLAQQLRRLSPSWQRPELFHETKSEIVGGILRISRRLAGRAMPAAMPLQVTPPRPLRLRYPAPTPPPPVPPVPVSPAQPRAATALSRRFRRHRYPQPPAHPGQLRLF